MITFNSIANKIICDDFTVHEKPNLCGITVIGYYNRNTGEDCYLQIEIYAETLYFALSPANESVFLNRCANAGFLITPTREAIDAFFNLALWDRARCKPLPKGAVVECLEQQRAKS